MLTTTSLSRFEARYLIKPDTFLFKKQTGGFACSVLLARYERVGAEVSTLSMGLVEALLPAPHLHLLLQSYSGGSYSSSAPVARYQRHPLELVTVEGVASTLEAPLAKQCQELVRALEAGGPPRGWQGPFKLVAD